MTTGAEPSFTWPITGEITIVHRFDPPPEPWLPGHRGVDLATTPDTEIRSAGPGTVAFAGTVAGRGVVSIDHPGGLRTTYEPLTPEVRRGQTIQTGDRLGTSTPGHPGCTASPCLHWGLRRDGVYLDPLLLLGAGRVRLLPIIPDR